MKKFTTKPIPGAGREEQNRAANRDSELGEFYNHALPIMEKPKTNLLRYFSVILLSILFGFGAGFAYNLFLAVAPETAGGTKVIIDKQEEVTVTSEERLREILLDLNQVVVGFYEKSETGGDFYQKKYLLGNGLIVTTDGWLATSETVWNNLTDKNFLVLTHDYQKYEVKKAMRDPLTKAVFVKIEATNLPVAKFGSKENLLPGQLLYALSANYPEPEIKAVHLKNLKQSTLLGVVDTTEELTHFIAGQEFFNEGFYGAPLISLSGELMAMVYDSELAIPMEDLKTAISDLGKKDKIDRAALGVHYISLADYPKLSGEEMLGRGALLTGEKNVTAVIKNSPADKAGLKVGDIITFVEDELVNSQKTLTEIIQAYEPGEKLKFTISRDGQEMAMEVELGKLE